MLLCQNILIYIFAEIYLFLNLLLFIHVNNYICKFNDKKITKQIYRNFFNEKDEDI